MNIWENILCRFSPTFRKIYRMEERLNTLDNKLDSSHGKLDGIYANIDRINERLEGINNKLDSSHGKLDGIYGKLDGIYGKVDGIYGKVDGIYRDLENLYYIKSYSTDFKNLPKPEGILKHVQNISKVMLEEFDRICRENNIEYWIQGGTLLGAYRHRGFIPWDDDADVGMMRQDIEKLLKVIEKEKLFDVQYFYHMNWEYPCRMLKFIFRGEILFWIDIFSYDYLEIEEFNNSEKQIIIENKIWSSFTSKRYKLSHELSNLKMEYNFVPIKNESDKNLVEKIFDSYTFESKINKTGNYIIFGIDNFISNYQRLFQKDTIFPLSKIRFEDKEYTAPRFYEDYIYKQYGNPFLLPKYFPVHINDIKNNFSLYKESIKRIYKKLGIDYEI